MKKSALYGILFIVITTWIFWFGWLMRGCENFRIPVDCHETNN
ncbi:MAG: hypothetical protein WC505_07295 [Patescibacteria group bacterium]